MKVSPAFLFAAGIDASHFRAVNYDVTQAGFGQLKVSRTMAWRRQSAGYPNPGCTSTDVANQTPATVGTESCTITSGGMCGSVPTSYIVTDIEDQLSASNNYCYGYQTDTFTKPSGPFSMRWSGGCWVTLTGDNGATAGGCGYGFIATVNDVDNNSPQVKIPPIWKIMAGCPAQTIALNPVDLDNDVVKCRWADAAEAQGAVHSTTDFGSLSLDPNTCVVTYDGTVDFATGGVKPIAVQVEDFDSNGNVRSSMPVQFLATVWTPSNTNFSNRFLSLHGPGSVAQMPDFFPIDDHEDSTTGNVRGRRQANLPAYCSVAPILVAPSPSAGTVISVPTSGTTINIKATSQNGAITRFVLNSPLGMSCTTVNGNGESTCSFTPTSAQQGGAHNFCFLGEDAAGMTTERRCVTLAVGVTVQAPASAGTPQVIEIISLIKHVIPSMEGDFKDYGCSGVGNMDASLKTVGKNVDEVDVALNQRKHCINCAIKDHGKYTTYDFDEDNNACSKIIHNLFYLKF